MTEFVIFKIRKSYWKRYKYNNHSWTAKREKKSQAMT